MFKIHDEPESPKEGACLRYMRKRNRQMRGFVEDKHESEEAGHLQ